MKNTKLELVKFLEENYGDKLYKAYFEIPTDDDGEEMEIDYTHAYKIVEIADEILRIC